MRTRKYTTSRVYANLTQISYFPFFTKYSGGIRFVKNGKNEIRPKTRLCTASSILMLKKKYKYIRGKVKSEIGSHLTVMNLILLIFMSNWSHLGIKYIYICIRSYDTGRSFDLIFMKFVWLVRVHSWVNSIVFGNNRLNRTTDMGKCTPKTSFSGLKQTVWGFLRKKLKNCIWYPIYQKKGYIHFCCPTPHSLKNGDVPQK